MTAESRRSEALRHAADAVSRERRLLAQEAAARGDEAAVADQHDALVEIAEATDSIVGLQDGAGSTP
jgi:hypothetical protein